MLSESEDRDRAAAGGSPGEDGVAGDGTAGTAAAGAGAAGDGVAGTAGAGAGAARAGAGNAATAGASPLRFLLSLFFTVTGNLYLLFGTTFFAVLSTSTGWIPLPHGGRFWFVLARWWSRLLLWSSGVLVRVEHLAPLERGKVYVFLCNHQSLFDIPVLLATLPQPARFLAKRELFRIPVFGWSLKVGGFIPVERGGKSAGDSFRAAAERVRRGGSVLLFPEETRSPDGKLLPFKRGGFLLAQKAGLPMVPVGIRGTLGVRPRTSYRIHPGRVLVRYGEPLPPPGSGRGGSAASIDQVRTRMAELAGVEPGEESARPADAD